MEAERAARWVALPIAVFAISTSSILIRLTSSPPLVTASYRLLVAAVVLLVIAMMAGMGDIRRLDRKTILLLGASGILLGAHFGLWTTALFHTSVGSAVFLVDTHPIIIGLLAPWLLREPTRMTTWVGIVLTTAGGGVIAAGDFEIGGAALVGDAMAVGAAATFAGYLLIGRRARQGLSTASYAGLVYAVAGLLLFSLAVGSGASLLPASPRDPFVWLALVLFPTLGGHTVFNWALRHVPASVVGVAILGEPVLATLLAWLVLTEEPRLSAAVGGAVVLVGLFVALWGGVETEKVPARLSTSGPPSP